MKEDDVTHHLVFAINGFLDRQAKKEPVDKEKVNTSDEFELKFPELSHGGLYRWRENLLPIFLFQKLKEILTWYSLISIRQNYNFDMLATI